MDPTSTPSPRFWANRQNWFVLGLLLLLAGLSVQYTVKVLDPRGTRSAIVRWREQLQALEDGEDIYARYVYPNPPIMALLLYPISELPPLAGALTWYYLKVGLMLVAFSWLFRLVQGRDAPFPPLGKALAVLLCLRPVIGDLAHGNVNLFILFLVLGALFALHKGRRFTGGLVLALAIACKVTPALFVPYFVWKRAWRTLAGCLVGLVLFFGPVPAAFLGWEENATQLHSWYQQMVKPYLVDGVVTSTHNNQSLPGLVYRLFTHNPSFLLYDKENRDAPPAELYHNVLSLEPPVAKRIVQAAMVLFVAVVVWTCRTPLVPRAGWRLAAEYSLVVLGMLLFSERTWKHHCVTLMLPFGVLCYYLTACRPSPRLRNYLIGTMAGATLLMASTSTSLLDVFGDDVAKLAQVYGGYVWAYVVLLAALVVLLRRPASAAAVEPDLDRPSAAQVWQVRRKDGVLKIEN